MTGVRSDPNAAATAAMLAAAAMIAYQVGGKATRDALFLSNYHVTALPAVLVLSSLLSIVVVLLVSRTMSATSPAKLVPPAFGVSGALLLGIWALSVRAERAAAVAMYFHVAVLGPVLISGFWSTFNERFDPRTAKRQIGRVAAFGTLGGVAGGALAGLIATRAGVSAMLPVLAALHFFSGAMIRRLGQPQRSIARPPREGATASAPMLSGLRYLGSVPYLRNLAILVLLGTISAALLDYVFKAYASAAFRRGPELMRLFSAVYVGVALLAFVIQTAFSRLSLERAGLAKTVAALPIVVSAGSVGALLAPGLASAMIARGAEAAFRNSLFRSGYELLFTPIPPDEKRATKTIVDVGFERLGDGLGGMLVAALLLLGPQTANFALLVTALLLGIPGILIAYWLHHGYVQTLESSLRRGAVQLDVSSLEDHTTRTTALRTIRMLDHSQRINLSALSEQREPGPAAAAAAARGAEAVPPRPRDRRGAPQLPTPGEIPAELQGFIGRVVDLRSGDAERIRRALGRDGPLDKELVPHVVPLLGRDEVAGDAERALQKAAPASVGQLLDFLLDPNQDHAVRRRIPRILGACPSEAAAQGLFRGLEDQRFEVRVQCGRALVRIREAAQHVSIDRDQVFAAVLREVGVERRVWEGQRQIDRLEDAGDSPFVDRYLRDRAHASLEHVFTLLALALPHRELKPAFENLHTDDQHMRGTALEYLEFVLPASVREKLWPFLEEGTQKRGSPTQPRPREEILADLLRSNESIRISLAELRKLQEGG